MLELESAYEEFLEFEEIENEFSILPSDPEEADKVVVEIIEDAGEKVGDCIKRFFSDKKMHYGGPIPEKLITSHNYLKLVANAEIGPCVDRAYEVLKDCPINCESTDGFVADDIRLVISIIRKCYKKQIPQNFVGGLILMYLEFCEGLDVEYIDLCR